MNKIKTALALAVLASLCALPVFADMDLTPPTDIKVLKNAAEHNDADAAFSLCAAYYNGKGVPKDEAESDKWCKKSSQIIAQKAPEPLSHLQPAR